MTIESLIIELLEEQGRVQLPGWGAFYLKAQPARWDAVTGTAFPAGKYLRFNPSVARTENTLLPKVMRSMGTSMEVAEHWITRKLNSWQQALDEGQVLMLSGLGSFSESAGFKPESNLFGSSNFGLTSIMLHPVHEPSALQNKVSASIKLVTEQREKGLRAWQRAAVAAAVTALFGLGVFQSDLPTQMAGWYGDFTSSDATIEEVTPTIEEVAEPAADVEELSTPAAEVKETKAVQAPIKGAGYYIVVGSFKEGRNAENLADELAQQGYDVSILPGSLNKVGIGNYQSRGAAKAELAKIKSEVNSHAWIFAY